MNAEVRAIKTPAEQALSTAYEGARAKLPGKGALANLREDAFKRFDAAGLPHRRVEEWKYTDLRALMRDAFPLAAPPDAAAKAKAKDAGKVFAGVDCAPAGLRRWRFRAGIVGSDAGSGADHYARWRKLWRRAMRWSPSMSARSSRPTTPRSRSTPR